MSMTMPNDFLDLFTEDKLPELKAVYKTKAESYPSMIPLLANIGSFGNSDIVQTTTISGVGDFGETLAGQDAKVGYIRPGFDNTIVAKKYTNSVIVPKEFITDTKQNLLKYAMESFAKGAFEIQEKKLAQIFLEAFSTTGYDGVALCSASHPLENGNGLTWSNLSSAADLDITSFRDTRDVLQDTPNEDGQLVNMMPKLFVCGQELQDKAHEIVKSMYNPENANNAVNSVYNIIQLLPNGYWPYLGNSTSFFMMADTMHHGIQFVKKEDLLIEGEYHKRNQSWEYTASIRFGQGVGQARGIVGNEGV